MKQYWSLLDPIVDLFEYFEEGTKFTQYVTNPIPGGSVINIAYLLILNTGVMGKSF